MTCHPSPRHLAGWIGIALFAFLPGCGGGPPGDVSGTVKLRGQAPKLAGLEIVFQSDDGSLVAAPIREDGTYKAEGVPAGVAKVFFSSTSEEAAREGLNTKQGGGRLKKPGGDKKGTPPPKLDGVYPKTNPIRQELREASTSKLTVTVASGKGTTFDYDLP